MFVAGNKASCAAPVSLSEIILRELLKVANAAPTDKTEPHATVHAYFGEDGADTHAFYTQTHTHSRAHST